MPGNAPAGPRRPCGDVPGSEVSLGKVLEHGFFQLCLRQKLFEPRVLLFQLSQPSGLLGLHPSVLLTPAVVGRLRHLDDAADVGDGLALGDQLLGGLEFADDLLRCVPGAFHGGIPGPAWPAEDSHSPWTGFRGPRHHRSAAKPARELSAQLFRLLGHARQRHVGGLVSPRAARGAGGALLRRFGNPAG